MVKKHRNSGTDRHYRKHQKIHDRWCSFQKECMNCKYIGRAGGIDVHGAKACFNKKSKNYMKLIRWGQSACACYEIGE